MLDIDKLQRTIKVCAKFPRRDCKGCEYIHDDWICLHDELMEDFDKAIEMLKEQEAVEPKPHPAKAWTRAKTLWFCGACGARISKRKTKYCQECGTAVKWT